MAHTENVTEMLDIHFNSELWKIFINAINYLMDKKSNQSNRNYVYQSFASFYSESSKFIVSEKCITDLNIAISKNEDHAYLIVLEMTSFIEMVDTLKEAPPQKKFPSGYLKDGLGIGKTIIDSIKDLAGLSKYVKMGLKIYSEAIDIYRGFLSAK